MVLEMDQAEENLNSHSRVQLSSQGSKASFHGNQGRFLVMKKQTGQGSGFHSAETTATWPEEMKHRKLSLSSPQPQTPGHLASLFPSQTLVSPSM